MRDKVKDILKGFVVGTIIGGTIIGVISTNVWEKRFEDANERWSIGRCKAYDEWRQRNYGLSLYQMVQFYEKCETYLTEEKR